MERIHLSWRIHRCKLDCRFWEIEINQRIHLYSRRHNGILEILQTNLHSLFHNGIRIYTGEEAEWVWQFLKDIPLWSKLVPAIYIHCNQVTIYKAQNFVYTGKSRHIRYRHNIVRRHSTARQLLSNGVIFIDFVSSKDKVADPFTKSLSGERINCALRGMRLKA